MRPLQLDARAKAEINVWTKRNQLVREIYFVEETLKKHKAGNVTKSTCWVKNCNTQTGSKSGLCKPHIQAAKDLGAPKARWDGHNWV